MEKVRTRFAPSPTGFLHIGSLRTALYNFLWAKNQKGKFFLRIEDTDRERLVEGAQEQLINILKTMGLDFDDEVVVQSTRLKLYRKAVDKLIEKGQAYYCFCSPERLEKLRADLSAKKQVPKYDRACCNLSHDEIKQKLNSGIKPVVRFKIPDNQIVEASDKVYDKISVKTKDLDDFVILKSNNFPTYHLANVVDDHDMRITHVIRGEEWLPSLPKHILLYDALGYDKPNFVHLPLLLNPDKSKLSKRQGDVAVEDYLKKGYLPEALLNYVSLLGWNPGNDREIFIISDLIDKFSLEKINKSGAVFDINKLNWFNAEYIKMIIKQAGKRFDQLSDQASTFLDNPKRSKDVLKLFASRINNLAELKDMSEFLFKLPDYQTELLVFKKSDWDKTKNGLNLALGVLGKIADSDWYVDKLNDSLNNIASQHNLSPGDIFWPVRVAASGLDKSPSPTEILEFLGKNESLNRIKIAIKKMS